MNTVFYKDYTDDDAMIQPTMSIDKIDHFPEVCISTFSKNIIDSIAKQPDVEIIAYLHTANGEIPIYKMKYSGKEFAFYLSLLCAPASVCCMEEVIALGAKKFVFFGCCGVLNNDVVQKKLIVPTAGIRDEGTSHHYVASSEEMIPDPALTSLLTRRLESCQFPYVTGKIWTTDAIYRETKTAIEERKKAGCIGVEMEYTALLAVAQYRNIDFIQFFYGADSLDQEEWKENDLVDYGMKKANDYFTLALECGVALLENRP